MKHTLLISSILLLMLPWRVSGQVKVPVPDKVLILILENHGLTEIIGSANAPYINSLADSGALFTQSYGINYPSQPNYLWLFSGANQGVVDNTISTTTPFTTLNLGASLLAKNLTFTGYSEDMPSIGYTGEFHASYVRKHNPWVNWQGTDVNGIPANLNQPLTSYFATSYANLPTVSIVVPNLIHNMHDGAVDQADQWIKDSFEGYIKWAKQNNALFILTFDEDDRNHNNNITTIFVGPMVKKGKYDKRIDHLSILRTLEDMYELPYAGASATTDPITDCWSSLIATLSNKNTSSNSSKSFTVFPNPSTNQDIEVNLMNEWKGTVDIMLYDMTGKKLKEVKLNKDSLKFNTTIATQAIEKGIYFVEIRYGGKKEIQKIEKN